MVVIPNFEDLKKKRDQLLQEQEYLISQIKAKYRDFYDWAVANNIDLRNLNQYSANIAAAFLISVGGSSVIAPSIDLSKQQAVTNTQESQQAKIQAIATEEFKGLNQAQKASLVWERYRPAIEKWSDHYNVDKRLVLATILLESGGNTHAIRHEPAINDASYGLGQILYGTAKGIGYTGTPDGLFDPETNIELIARYHRRNMDVYGDLSAEELTIAYNAGSPYSTPYPGHLQKFNNFYREARHLII